MTDTSPPTPFATFGEYLRHLRRRARLTQRELGAAVGYSEAHIARLESNQRMPDPAVVSGRLVEALGLKDDADAAAQLIRLAETARATKAIAAPAGPTPPTNLRAQLTSFVGRAEEIAEVKKRLGETRLLTLTGPGGVGKTRLAVQVATELLPQFEGGVWVVPLAWMNDERCVSDATAAALDLPRPASGEPVPLEVLRDHLHDRRAMIVLDTCEHLIGGCAALAVRLVQMCPRLTLLATSREPLNVPGEMTWQVPPMRCEEAMRLFIERAKSVRPEFTLDKGDDALLIQICQQLDGLPLAIELAAARLRVLSLEQIAARLDDRFTLLTGGNRLAPPKQQTLRMMMDWSYDLLSDAERALLRRLSIFTADWTLELAEAVCAQEPVGPDDRAQQGAGVVRREAVLDLLTQLVNKSLVIVDESGAQPRYSLSNTIRQYAHEKLVEAGEFDAVYRRYLAYLPFATQAADLRREARRAVRSVKKSTGRTKAQPAN